MLAQPKSNPIGIDTGDVVIAPWSTFAHRFKRLPADIVDTIVVRAASSSQTARAEAEVRGLLNASRGREPTDPGGFSVLNVNESLKSTFHVK